LYLILKNPSPPGKISRVVIVFHSGMLRFKDVIFKEKSQNCQAVEVEIYPSAFSVMFFLLCHKALYIDLEKQLLFSSVIAADWCSWADCKCSQMTQAAVQPSHYCFVCICHSI
jgi:hypothetical protein